MRATSANTAAAMVLNGFTSRLLPFVRGGRLNSIHSGLPSNFVLGTLKDVILCVTCELGHWTTPSSLAPQSEGIH
jgi:hypothetical protein